MNEHPIAFSGEMIRQILAGNKTQTRRVVKNSPCTCGNPPGVSTCKLQDIGENQWACGSLSYTGEFVRCPYGKPGDRLWVRENWCYVSDPFVSVVECVGYAADKSFRNLPEGTIKEGATVFNWEKPEIWKFKPSIHMPRAASRITLEITNIRVERLQDISEDDAKAEGIQPNAGDCGFGCECCELPTTIFARLWDKINGKKYPWNSNPYVWVIEFTKI